MAITRGLALPPQAGSDRSIWLWILIVAVGLSPQRNDIGPNDIGPQRIRSPPSEPGGRIIYIIYLFERFLRDSSFWDVTHRIVGHCSCSWFDRIQPSEWPESSLVTCPLWKCDINRGPPSRNLDKTTTCARWVQCDKFCIKNEKFRFKNEEFCIKNEKFWIKNEELCMKNEEFCI